MANTPLVIPELGESFIDYRQEIWGDSFNWNWNRRSDEIQYLAIHHSVTAHEATPDDIALLHKARGWLGVGYHFIITKDGKVWYVGDIGTARANVADMNEKVIGICMIGDFTQHLPSDEQIISCHKLCQFFINIDSVPNINDWEDIVGHKQLQATACPGTSWDKALPDNMWTRIRDGRPYTPPPAPEGSSTEVGQDTTIKEYDEIINALVEVTRPPLDQRKWPQLKGWIQTITIEAGKKKEIEEAYVKFVVEVARTIECKETEEKAVLEALRNFTDNKNQEVTAIKEMRLSEFSLGDLIRGVVAKLRPH